MLGVGFFVVLAHLLELLLSLFFGVMDELGHHCGEHGEHGEVDDDDGDDLDVLGFDLEDDVVLDALVDFHSTQLAVDTEIEGGSDEAKEDVDEVEVVDELGLEADDPGHGGDHEEVNEDDDDEPGLGGELDHDEAVAVEEGAPVAEEADDGEHHEDDDDGLEDLDGVVGVEEVEVVEEALGADVQAADFFEVQVSDLHLDDDHDQAQDV